MKLPRKVIKGTFNKFKNAFEGIVFGLKYDTSIILQIGISIFVVIVCIVIGIDDIEWLFVGSAIASVLIAEFLNSAIEDMCDLLIKKHDYHVKEIKDISAAAVLLAALYALFVAVMIIKGRIL